MPLLDDKKAQCSLLIALLLVSNLPAWGGDKSKDEEAIRNAATVLQAMLHKGVVPASLLATANCILIVPHVKHFAVGVGGGGGHGPLTCRKGKNFSGNGWSAPAMYRVGGAERRHTRAGRECRPAALSESHQHSGHRARGRR